MCPSRRLSVLTLLVCSTLAPAARAADEVKLPEVHLHLGADWRKMPVKEATAKAVEAMVVKNKFLHAETKGNVVIGWGETAAALVRAVPQRDGVYVTILAASADGAEAEKLRNDIRSHIFTGRYDPKIPAALDRKLPGRTSTALRLHYRELEVADDALLLRASARSSLVQHGLEPEIPGDGSILWARKAGVMACVASHPASAAGKTDVLVVVASSREQEATALTNALAADIKASRLPAALDLCKYQTGIRNQGGRDVCPYFPPVAALEAAYCRAGHKVDLSAEHLVWLRNVTCAGDNGKTDVAENLVSTLGGGNGMGVLSTYFVCRNQDLPYRGNDSDATIGKSPYYKGYGLEKYDWSKPFSQFVLNRWNLDPGRLPPQARANAKYRIEKFASLPRSDVNNPRKFEEVLASGREIIFAVMLHQDIYQVDQAKPAWRRKPGSPYIGYHFMMIVGYDRQRKFFVVKNQWGPTNYSASKNRLAEDWKDVVRFNGYTLMDYNYLAGCGEAHYITEVTPVDSPSHVAQRALGQWETTFKHKDKTLMTGVLCWRRLPDRQVGGKSSNRRIGDLITKDGRQFRVNANLFGDGTKPPQVTLYIDFVKGVLATDSTAGTAWRGTLSLPEKGDGSLRLRGPTDSKQELWEAPVSEIQMSAALIENKNLLKEMTPPK